MRTSGKDPVRLAAISMLLAGSLSGCSLEHYREDADQETYPIIAEKTADPRWSLRSASIEPPPESRLFDPSDPGALPEPPDDPAAHRYVPGASAAATEQGTGEGGGPPAIEDPGWRRSLELSESGKLRLSSERAMELALLHSREYQFELEELYLTALALTFERFDFAVQWFGGNTTEFAHAGDGDVAETNSLTTRTSLGFSRALSTGGQFLVELANSFVWEFAGANTQSVSTNVAVEFVQPLLRGAGRRIRLEQLTQAERAVLYSARDFARFRKQFYFDVQTGDGGFLSLLLNLQSIRNLQYNLTSLERNLLMHEALSEAGIVSSIQVDQVFQSYQGARLSLIEAENDFETSLDNYKIILGLPPDLEIDLDDALLAPFQLNDPGLAQLEKEADQFLATYRELETAPTAEQLRQAYGGLRAFNVRLKEFRDKVTGELERWRAMGVKGGGAEGQPDQDNLGATRERATQKQLTERLEELNKDSETLGKNIDEAEASLSGTAGNEEWERLLRLARQVGMLVGDLFVVQTQIRAYLIDLVPVAYQPATAVELALRERLDLMNVQGRVFDAWRQVNVAADGLGTDFNLVLGANIGTEPGSPNPVKFSASGSSYRAGFQLDGPLNRKAERNIYRFALINYERARRIYMALRDRVTRSVRLDLRRLRADRLNFEIARQSLIAAARQVEQAREQLTAPGRGGDSSSTQDVLDALSSLLRAKNNLIRNWVDYETDRLKLLLDVEAVEFDGKDLLERDMGTVRQRLEDNDGMDQKTSSQDPNN